MNKGISLFTSMKFLIYILTFAFMAVYCVISYAHTFDVHLDPVGDYIIDQEKEAKRNEDAYNRIEKGEDRPGDAERALDHINSTWS